MANEAIDLARGKKVAFRVMRGQVIDYTILVKNPDGTDYNFTGHTAQMFVYNSFSKTDTPEYTITVALAAGSITFTHAAISIKKEEHVYQLWITDNFGYRQVWLNGPFLILNSEVNHFDDEEVTFSVGEQAGISFEEEGVALGTRGTVTELDFVGAGVAASRVDNKVTVTVSGNANFRGVYVTLVALQAAIPTGNAGDYADVDAGVGTDVQRYIWDIDDADWILGGGASFTLTNGNGTTANGTAVDLGGNTTGPVTVVSASENDNIKFTTDDQAIDGYAAQQTTHEASLYAAQLIANNNAGELIDFTIGVNRTTGLPVATFSDLRALKTSVVVDPATGADFVNGSWIHRLYADNRYAPITRTINGQDLSADRILPNSLYYSITGRYISNNINQAAPGTLALGTSFRCSPFIVMEPLTFDSIISEVTALSASTTYRLGIYTDNGSKYPNALIANTDVQAYDSGSTGVKTGTPAASVSLPIGLYWIAYFSNGGPTVRAWVPGSLAQVLGAVSTLTASSQGTLYSVAQAYGAMPSTFPVGATILNNANAAAMWLRKV